MRMEDEGYSQQEAVARLSDFQAEGGKGVGDRKWHFIGIYIYIYFHFPGETVVPAGMSDPLIGSQTIS